MKKILLYSIALLAINNANSQTDFYPTGSITTPTWGYYDVVGDDYGSYYNPTTARYSCGIADGFLDYSTISMSDAYDGAFEVFVGIEDSTYTETGLSTLNIDTTGTTITLAEQLISGLYISKKYFFSPTTPVVRAQIIVRNPSAASISTNIGVFSNMGSDSETKMDSSYTDGLTMSDLDRWIITTDSTITGDPILTWARFGPGTIACTPVFGQKPELGSDNFLDTFAVTVPANSSIIILQFNRMDSLIATARLNASSFNTAASLQSLGFLTGMSAIEMSQVVNWDFYPLYAGMVETYNTANNISIHPNPSKGLFNLALNTTSTVTVTDLTGKVVFNQLVTEGTQILDLTEQAKGAYLVKITTENSEHIQKIIKE